MTRQPKPKRCKVCKAEFIPVRPMQKACSVDCAKAMAVSERGKREAKEAAKDRAETRKRKEANKTLPQLHKEAQIEFNKFIRNRDKDKPCICCGRPLNPSEVGGGFDCGHYRSVGSAPHLRYTESNAHGQTKHCNRYGAGRAVDYRIGLVARIGLEAVGSLEANNTVRKWTRDEVRAIRDEYRARNRHMKDQT
ncbi:hypothetical protein FVQ98_14135 [Ottowia sp. GY511]|uniref:Recombination protein NinG n=1 Tax=Ottowia flava TaxID=2675430 RepID=A0ABW4KPX7_9BURK|nr:recombination protein NinG [Ottowia sp. GY511]TXK26512.1 hypothetical protein FVQ98_14135 [Ottowia sp. GY511]